MDLAIIRRGARLLPAAAILGGAATLAACATAPAPLAVSPAAPAMALGPRTAPPSGYLLLCQREPEACAPAGSRGRVDHAEAGEIRRTAGQMLWRGAFNGDAAKPAALSPAHPAEAAPAAATRAADVETLSVAPAEGEAALEPVAASVAPLLAPAPADTAVAPVTVNATAFAPPALTQALWAELRGVNARVNAAIKSASDQAVYGVEDYWTLPLKAGGPALGDCEDYVLEKRRALVEDGLPETALSIALVTTRWGESHAVLLVATDKGELVLDSLNPEVLFWTKTAYAWDKRQVRGEAFDWAEIAEARTAPPQP
jgi:predicted transglutaminase-like cysteine proteinase